MMPKSPSPVNGAVLLDSAWLRNRVAELGLRQWWLAEQIGVDKKTVVRWMNGHVRTIQAANAEALAAVLQCRVSDLRMRRDAIDLATADDQRAAATALASSSLVDKLGPIGEWNVIESLLKAVAVADLPLHVLGELYHRLCVACWRQDKFDEAERYNEATFDAARRCGDQALLASAHASRANLLHWRGDSAAALDHYRQGLDLQRFIDPPAVGSLLTNLGACLCELGDIDNGRARLLDALDRFRFGGSPMQRSIVHAHLAIVALRRELLDEAAWHVDRGDDCARRCEYRRGLAMGALLRAELLARRGESSTSFDALARGKEAFARLKIVEGLNFEFEGRVLRLLRRLDASRDALLSGIRVSKAFPLQLGHLHAELASTLRASGERDGAEASARRAIALFGQCGAPLLVAEVARQATMSPHVPCPGDAEPIR